MQSFIPQVTICASAVLLMLAPALAQQQPQHVMVNPSDINWTAAPPSLPKGAQMALLYGDPTKDGVFVMRLKFPANYRIPPHTHPNDEIVTVLSGEVGFGMGTTFDPAKTKAIEAGGVIAMPPGTQHFVQNDQETVVQLSSRGPWSIAYVNPADDPRKSQ
ncbi:cupin domain-containing protein [Microvirga lotononidis]|uniref:Cupin n=1 Tax=Microvirga lotononidis TaxID=864069 RepID=I4YKU9_9HYPH|nr:cupin domain-containing protein [Microvirga lotononidis]EIM24591.1 Cupin [Microvirga lotononidis]WQO26606.1 cupin domain-containing protein [Microvirga lotononidis]